jgi:hypothetical protein
MAEPSGASGEEGRPDVAPIRSPKATRAKAGAMPGDEISSMTAHATGASASAIGAMSGAAQLQGDVVAVPGTDAEALAGIANEFAGGDTGACDARQVKGGTLKILSSMGVLVVWSLPSYPGVAPEDDDYDVE